MKPFFLSLFVILGIFASYAASAAEIELVKGAKGVDAIVISGDINTGDDRKFKQIAVTSESAIVLLSSNGGALVPALEMGKAIQIRGYKTYVPDGETCTSSCALIWLAGSERLLSRTAKLGFHASYRNNNGRLEEVGVANAIIGRYLTLLNLTEKSVVFVTAAPPQEMLWLTASTASQSGIVFRYFDAGESAAQPVAPPPIQTIRAEPASDDDNAYHKSVAWYYATDDVTGTLYYVRAEDVEAGRSGSSAADVWVKTDSSKDRTVGYYTAKVLYTVNCNAKTYKTKTGIAFFRDGRTKDFAASYSWEHIYPDSAFEVATSLVCTDNFPEAHPRDELKD